MLSIYYFRLLFFFFYSSVDHRDLHSFPTRRSSDLSATPYFLGRVGQDTNKPFPWVVSDFGLIDAIESGLVKIPQLAIRDPTGATLPSYFNIWRWIMTQLTPAERGGKKGTVKPEAILKYAHHPIAILANEWE